MREEQVTSGEVISRYFEPPTYTITFNYIVFVDKSDLVDGINLYIV